MDKSGAVWSAWYAGGHNVWITFREPGQAPSPPALDDGHTVVFPCPAPVVLTEDSRGVLSCDKPLK
jgi:hypothetical protein